MPSRAITSFLLQQGDARTPCGCSECQCPLGLLLHFYLRGIRQQNKTHPNRCQCPLGLLLHFYNYTWKVRVVHTTRVNALSGYYFISTVPLQKPRFYATSRAYFGRYLSEYSDNGLFLCMFIIWTYFSRFFCFFTTLSIA